MAEIPKASLLKDEGNALFSKKNYGAAYKKYTEAIEEDGSNAILYANRAACSLNLKRFALNFASERLIIFIHGRFLDTHDDAYKVRPISPSHGTPARARGVF